MSIFAKTTFVRWTSICNQVHLVTVKRCMTGTKASGISLQTLWHGIQPVIGSARHSFLAIVLSWVVERWLICIQICRGLFWNSISKTSSGSVLNRWSRRLWHLYRSVLRDVKLCRPCADPEDQPSCWPLKLPPSLTAFWRNLACDVRLRFILS